MSTKPAAAPKATPAPTVAPHTRRALGDSLDALLSGGLITTILVSIFAVWAIALQFVPSLDEAHASTVFATEASPLFEQLRALFWFGHSGIFVAAMGLIALRVWRRKHGRGLRTRWYLTLLALALFGLWSFTASILPLDQGAWHGTLARKGVIEATPILGEMMAAWLFPNGTINQGTYSLFVTLALGVLPALMLLVALGLWRARSTTRSTTHGIGMLLFLGLLALGAYFLPQVALLEIAPRPEYPNVRPEWFFFPVSLAIKLTSGAASPEFLRDGAALAPLIVMPILVALPFLSGRWHWHADRAALAIGGVGFVGLLAMGLADDMASKDGAFFQPELEDIMAEMGTLNKSVGSDGALDRKAAYASIADLLILADQSTRAADYAKDVKDLDAWVKMSGEMREAALVVWKSAPKQLDAAYDRLRTSCQKCHDAYEEEVELRSFASKDEGTPQKIEPKVEPKIEPDEAPVKPDVPAPAAFTGYDAEALATLKPLKPAPSAFSSGKEYEAYMKEMLRLLKRIMESDPRDVLQDLVDLRAQIGPMALDDPALRQWIIESEMYFTEDGLEDWRKRAKQTLQGTDLALGATSSLLWYDGVEAIRAGCVGCHDDFDFKEGKIEIPPLVRQR